MMSATFAMAALAGIAISRQPAREEEDAERDRDADPAQRDAEGLALPERFEPAVEFIEQHRRLAAELLQVAPVALRVLRRDRVRGAVDHDVVEHALRRLVRRDIDEGAAAQPERED